jgi:hypothetical protein
METIRKILFNMKIRTMGTRLSSWVSYPESGQVTLARLRPNPTFGQAFRSIQYIHPVFRHIVTIDCYDFKNLCRWNGLSDQNHDFELSG